MKIMKLNVKDKEYVLKKTKQYMAKLEEDKENIVNMKKDKECELENMEQDIKYKESMLEEMKLYKESELENMSRDIENTSQFMEDQEYQPTDMMKDKESQLIKMNQAINI